MTLSSRYLEDECFEMASTAQTAKTETGSNLVCSRLSESMIVLGLGTKCDFKIRQYSN